MSAPDSGNALANLPSSQIAAGRFVRAAFYAQFVRKADSPDDAVITLGHIMNNFDRPYDLSIDEGYSAEGGTPGTTSSGCVNSERKNPVVLPVSPKASWLVSTMRTGLASTRAGNAAARSAKAASRVVNEFFMAEVSTCSNRDAMRITKSRRPMQKKSNVCRSMGVQGSPIDFLICAIAVRLVFRIYTTDSDFELYEPFIPIELYRP